MEDREVGGSTTWADGTEVERGEWARGCAACSLDVLEWESGGLPLGSRLKASQSTPVPESKAIKMC